LAALGQRPPAYWHVPLWRDGEGRRLSKRDADAGVLGWRERGGDAAGLVGWLAASLGLVPVGSSLSAPELLQTIEAGLLALQQQRDTAEIHEIMRAAHSLKGGAPAWA
jgi:glutamyl-tRNA synthetase